MEKIAEMAVNSIIGLLSPFFTEAWQKEDLVQSTFGQLIANIAEVYSFCAEEEGLFSQIIVKVFEKFVEIYYERVFPRWSKEKKGFFTNYNFLFYKPNKEGLKADEKAR